MREADFGAWLKDEYVGRNGAVLPEQDRASRLWVARRIEQYEGDLDRHFDRDHMAGLLNRLAYTSGESARGLPPRHKIPVGANAYIGALPENVGSTGIPGLFTSITNAAYVPTTFLRPTDFSGLLRNLLQRRAAELYGSVCRLLPGDLRFCSAASPAWETSAFTWAAPVGTSDHLTAFLAYRRTELQRLFDERKP
jgi:hypothetical protein